MKDIFFQQSNLGIYFTFGLRHTVGLKRDQQTIVMFGSNMYGQIKMPIDSDLENVKKYKEEILKFDQKIKYIGAGEMYTIAIKEDGSLVGWGENKYSTISPEKQDYIGLYSFNLPEKAHYISCGRIHVICNTENRKVYGWGFNLQNCLGAGRNEVIKSPRHIEGLPHTAVQVVVGVSHSVVLCEDGVYSFGNNEVGQCGFSVFKTISFPSKIALPDECGEVKGIGSMATTTFFLFNDGSLYFAGSCDRKEGGYNVGDDNKVHPIQKVMFHTEDIKISKLGIGRISCNALTKDGKHIVWGYSSFGTCLSEEESVSPCEIDTQKFFKNTKPINVSGMVEKKIDRDYFYFFPTSFKSNVFNFYMCWNRQRKEKDNLLGRLPRFLLFVVVQQLILLL
eukprot:TRINITY_DN963_c0_g1_i2.p1 TRINITY_DN963_c0_g1~~TRINITY_DN963_c0_g1_i2.p1  ORF type:complete len:393 (-),score=71.26 TRINITY_DN963_c0_g1_i2:50-1228(-)